MNYMNNLKFTEYKNLSIIPCSETNFRDVTARVKDQIILGEKA